MRGAIDMGLTSISLTVLATRGVRLELCRMWVSGEDRPDAFRIEFLSVVEIDADERIVARVAFDSDDIDAAFAELDARFLAGEAAPFANTWSAVAGFYAALNRHEILATPDWVNVDHRRATTVASGDMAASIRATWDVAPNITRSVEAVHRLNTLGAVVTHTANGTSREGFDAEWRLVALLTFTGDLISRAELFDETDLDAALARFDELDRHASSFANAATRTWERLVETYNRRDIDGWLALTAADGRVEDRRKGLHHIGVGPAWQKTMRAWLNAPRSWRMDVETLAIRGSRLSLTRNRCRDSEEADQPVTVEVLAVMEVDEAGLVRDAVSFDPDDIDDAFAELTARWIASGEVTHPEVAESAQRLMETMNRRDWNALAALSVGATFINHRQLSSPGIDTMADQMSSIEMMASLVPDYRFELAEVLTHSARGLVTHVVLRGTSTDGVAIEIPLIGLVLFDGDRVDHIEAFDADQRDLALARFEELNGAQ